MAKFVAKEEDEDESFRPSFRSHYDVFLSFRGEDTRHTFTDRLYRELVRHSIHTFRDDDELRRGDEIAPSLLSAIEDSTAAIIVISKNYATSKWCLEELAYIVDCGRWMLPVFYQVDPSDVRRQKGSFEEAFRDHERRLGKEGSSKILRWRRALEKAGNIAGWDSGIWEEAQLIQSLIEEIMTKLSNTPLAVAKHPVGISSRVEEVMQMLEVKSCCVKIVGFHGMGGIGKTTLAKAIYNRTYPQFQHRSFVSNIRTTWRQPNGVISLQNKFLHELFPNNPAIVHNVSDGITVIRNRIQEKRVLVVLDDVDDASQLDVLIGSTDWLYVGSRVIITTRDCKILTPQLVNEIYEVKELSLTESLQLFSYHAFRREKPADAFMNLSKQVVSHTGGLPLALEVLGAFLYDKKRKKEWEDVLEKLKQVHPGHLHEVLKISFDGLDDQDKCIFLDIACLFVEMEINRESVVDIWKGCGFSPEIALTVLMSKSLVKIINKDTLWMHDQLRDMGRQIVRRESGGDLGMLSRMWDRGEILSVLKHKKGTRKVQGIILDFENNGLRNQSFEKAFEGRSDVTSTSELLKDKFQKPLERVAEEENEGKLYTEAFGPMVNLRLLQINHAHLVGKLNLLPAGIKWLKWKGCHLDALPPDFYPQELAVLDLTESKIKHVWDKRCGVSHKMAEKLIVLNLLGCCDLIATPDFSLHPNLEKLILERCKKLSKIDKSIRTLRQLVLLNLRDCSNLVEFPKDVSGLRSLETLVISGCTKVKELPDNLKSLKSLKELLADRTSVKKLPDSIFRLKKLERLSLNDCTLLKRLPRCIGELTSLRELSLDGSALEELPDSIRFLTRLEVLSLIGCRSLTALPDAIGNLKSLLRLQLNNSSIMELPASIGSLSHLKCLSAERCKSLTKLPDSIGGLSSLIELQLGMTAITKLPDEIGALNRLKKLDLRNCELLSRLPNSIGNMVSLTFLILNNSAIMELPESLGLLESLEGLNVNECRRLTGLPQSIRNLVNLRELLMEKTSAIEWPEELGMLSSLVVLKMAKSQYSEQPRDIGEHGEFPVINAEENRKLVVLPVSFCSLSLLEVFDARRCNISGRVPDEFENLTALEDLNLGHNSFWSLPSSLSSLSVLKKLSLARCTKLKSLPPLPSSLIFVDVTNCSALVSISNLSNLEKLEEFRLTNCTSVIDVPGVESLRFLKRLYMGGCTACHSVVKRRLGKVALKRLRYLCVPGHEIPNWFVQEVPSYSSDKTRQIKDVIICVVISLDQQKKDDYREKVPALVDVKARILRDDIEIFSTVLYLIGIPSTPEDQVYLCRFLHFHPLVSLLKDGDKIQVTVRNPPLFNGLQLKKYGIHLVFEDDDDYSDDEKWLDESEKSVSEKLSGFLSTSTEEEPLNMVLAPIN